MMIAGEDLNSTEPPKSLASGPLEVRLATDAAEIEAAQALRYRVFYEEMTARPSPEMAARRRDHDAFDDHCDHLLVIDTSLPPRASAVVGTYRLLRRNVALRHSGFYSSAEYDISALLDYPGEILELGRSCVDAVYRSSATMQLLWRGISSYISRYRVGLMFGCASLPGTQPRDLALPLSYLHHRHLAPPALRPRALPERYVGMNFMDSADFDPRMALSTLPPLIKGYLRLGGFVGDGAVIDYQFNTTDVCVVVKTDLVTEKYSRHYQRSAQETWVS